MKGFGMYVCVYTGCIYRMYLYTVNILSKYSIIHVLYSSIHELCAHYDLVCEICMHLCTYVCMYCLYTIVHNIMYMYVLSIYCNMHVCSVLTVVCTCIAHKL